MSSVSKGAEFEVEIASILSAKGYSVKHNVNMVGRSGATHQIDVLAEYQCPLHTDTIIIEAKNHDSNINKDTVMKLANIQQDLSVGNAILATTSDFTIGARQTAAQYKNLNLWNGSQIIEMLPTDSNRTNVESVGTARFVHSVFSRQTIEAEASTYARKKSSGGFFSRATHEEAVHDIQEVLYPYYEASVKAHVRQKEKTGFFSKETVTRTLQHSVSVDGVTGELVDFSDPEPYVYAYMHHLTVDEIDVLALCNRNRKIKRQNAVVTGLPANKVKTILTNLEANGLIRRVSDRPVTYKIAVPFPRRPDDVAGLAERYSSVITDKDPGFDKVGTEINPHEIGENLGKYWDGCVVGSTRLVWYPYYKVTYKRSDGSKSVNILDGMTGERRTHLEGFVVLRD